MDDEPSLTELLSMVMRQESWDVRCAHNGGEAIRAARGFRPDAIVLDIMLPDMDGIELLRFLMHHPGRVLVLLAPGQVSVQVADDGPGIPAHVLPHVSGRFARGDGSGSRLAGGSGLGLAIVSAVAAAHGGRVEVAGVPGNTVFTLRLPASREQVPPGEGGASGGHEPGGDQGEPGGSHETGR
ncbi:ATP-binding protein [Nonomuraea rubra]|uniref:ATP-binding protein n=1 Tax=Nonomuraea rubra TaxID=46180 RepID=UPI0033D67240